MSTICKLNPNIRTRRFDRATVVKELQGLRNPAAWALAAVLDKFRKVPFLTGPEKDRTFTRVLREAKERGVLG